MANKFKYDEYAGYRCLSGIAADTSALYLTHCGMELCSPKQYWGPGSRPDYHLHFILEGKGMLETGGKSYELHRGQIFLLLPNTPVKYYAHTTDPWYYAWASFNGKKAEEYLCHAGFNGNIVVRECFYSPEDFTAVIHKMLQANDTKASDQLKRMGFLHQLFSLLIRSNTELPEPRKFSADHYVQSAVEYIQYHYNSDIHISDLADYLQLNRSYLSTCFKKTMGCTPKAYLIKYRMEKAKELLAHSPLAVSDIAQKLGYLDQAVFSKTFSRSSGQSPKAYRNAAQIEK